MKIYTTYHARLIGIAAQMLELALMKEEEREAREHITYIQELSNLILNNLEVKYEKKLAS